MIEELKSNNGQYLMQLKSYEEKNKDMEGRIVALTLEIERLNAILDARKREIEDRKQKLSQIEITLLQYRGFEDKYKEAEQKISVLIVQIEELNKKCQHQQEYLAHYKLQEAQLVEYEKKYMLLSNEIERLNNVIKIKLTEIEDWRQKYANLELQLTKIKQYESKIQEQESRIILMANEIQRINVLYQQKCQEGDEWKNKYNQIIIQFSGYDGRIKELETRCVQ